MEGIQEQIRVQMQKAFWDLLQEKVEQVPPDVDWLTRLYKEIVDRLVSFVINGGGRTAQEIRTRLDPELFNQMLLNNAFQSEDMLNLISSTFDFILKLQAPERDFLLQEKKAKILLWCQEGRKFSEVVPLYIRSTHEMLDILEDDLKKLADRRGSSAQV